MTPSRQIVVLGSSLLLAALADHLEQQPGLVVTRINPHLADALERVKACAPDVVLAEIQRDSDPRQEQTVMSLLVERPGMPIIGLDMTSHTTTVLSSHQVTIDQVADLKQMIEQVERATRWKWGPHGPASAWPADL
jgi:chemotaxis response regulator CheB